MLATGIAAYVLMLIFAFAAGYYRSRCKRLEKALTEAYKREAQQMGYY